MQLTLPRMMLFALTLILGQWLTLAHASEHPALQPEKAGCELCLHIQQLGSSMPTVASLAILQTTHESPAVADLPAARVTPLRHYPIRGPPQLLA